MKRPGGSTLLLGHPLVAVPLILGGLGVLWACWQLGSDGVLFAIGTLLVLARVLKASEQFSHYRAWKRAWDGMAEPRPGLPRWRRVGGVVCLVLLAVYGSKELPPDQLRMAIVFIAIVLALVIVWAVAKWTRRHMPRSRRRDCVSVAVGAPLMRVPKLQAAYRALPDYCQRVLDGEPR